MDGFNLEMEFGDPKFKKYFTILSEPAERAKLALSNVLGKSIKRFKEESDKLEDGNQKTLLLKKLHKISNEFEVLKNLSVDDIVMFALTTQQKIMNIASNPRIPRETRLKARVACHKPLSTYLARVKNITTNESEESDEEEKNKAGIETSKKLNKIAFNNKIVTMRKDVRRAKVHVISKLSRTIKKIREMKAGEDKKEKFEKKAERLVKKIKYIKDLVVDDVSRYALTTTEDLNKLSTDEKMPMTSQAMATIANYKFVAAHVKNFRNKFPDWHKAVPPLLKKKKKKRMLSAVTKNELESSTKTLYKQSEAKGNIRGKNILKSENKVINEEENSESDQFESESDEEEKNDQEKKSDEEEEVEDDENDNKLKKTSSFSENDNNHNKRITSKNKIKTTLADMCVDIAAERKLISASTYIIENKIVNKEVEDDEVYENIREVSSSSDSNIYGESKNYHSEKSPNKSNVKTKTKLAKQTSRISAESKASASPNIIENKTLSNKVKSSINISKSSEAIKNEPKVVDPFFMTTANEEYVTSQIPDTTEDGSASGRYERNSNSSFSNFDKFDNRNKWKSKRDDWKESKFSYRASDPYKKPVKSNFEKLPNDTRKSVIVFGNRKERRKALQHPLQEEKVEKLHPSWEAKKKQTAIAPFQGKKITFD